MILSVGYRMKSKQGIYFRRWTNSVLKQGDHLLVEGNALAAMTLMVALSDPSEKDAMVALVENFIA